MIRSFKVGTDFISLADGLSLGQLDLSSDQICLGDEVLTILPDVKTSKLLGTSFIEG